MANEIQNQESKDFTARIEIAKGTMQHSDDDKTIVIKFDEIPDSITLNYVKQAGFKWNKVDKTWEAPNNDETRERMTEVLTDPPTPEERFAEASANFNLPDANLSMGTAFLHIKFDEKPDKSTLQTVKNAGFHWSKKNQDWEMKADNKGFNKLNKMNDEINSKSTEEVSKESAVRQNAMER